VGHLTARPGATIAALALKIADDLAREVIG
jgi:hypothetical protein